MTLTNQERRNVNVESIHCRHYSMRRRHRQIFRYESHKWYLEMFCTRLTPWRRSRNQAAEYRVVDMIAAFTIHQTSTIPYLSRLWCGWSWALSSVSPSAGIMIAPLCSCPATPSYHSLRPPARAGNEPRESRSLRGLLQVVSPYLHFHIKDTRYYLTIKTLLC